VSLSDADKLWFDKRFDVIDKRFDVVDKRLDAADKRFDDIGKRFDDIDKRFDDIDKRFDVVDKRLDAADKRFDDIDKRFDAIDKRFENIDKQFDNVYARLEKVDKRLDNLTTFTLDMRTEVIRRFDALEQRVDFMANAMLNVQPLTKGMLDLGALMGQMTRAQQISTDRHFDLETRLLNLEETVSKLVKSAA
jgi:predicted  nucleic acid-binding Zn-ribbon protein